MVRPNYIPRTLRGVGGIRLFDIPGVIYPEEILRPAKGLSEKTGQAFTTPPPWGICTHEAARMLGCSSTAARIFLHKQDIPFQIVAAKGKTQCIYWSKQEVQNLCDKRLPIVKCQPAKTLSAAEARALLKIGRSTLYRYVQKRMLREVQVRMITEKGTRKMSFYLKAEVKKLAAKLNAARLHEIEAQHLRKSSARRRRKHIES